MVASVICNYFVSLPYKTSEHTPKAVREPAIAYQRRPATTAMPSADKWNPNVPFHITEEEWLEYIRQIEQGPFFPVSEVHQRISQWLDNQKT